VNDSAARTHPTRLLVLAALFAVCSPGVLLGWGFSLGMVAGCAICACLWWVNHD
jgi:hypothetical protein